MIASPNSSLRLQPARTGTYPTNRTRDLHPEPQDFRQRDVDFLELLHSLLGSWWQRIASLVETQLGSSAALRENSRLPRLLEDYLHALDYLLAYRNRSLEGSVTLTPEDVIDELTRLGANWDGNDGIPLDRSVAATAKDSLRLLAPIGLGIPFMYPSPTGGLIAEWEYRRGRITLHIETTGIQLFSIGPSLELSVSEWDVADAKGLAQALINIRDKVT